MGSPASLNETDLLRARVAELEAQLRAREERIERREAQLALIMDNVPALVSYIDAGQVYRRINGTYIDWTGRTPAEILGRTIGDVIGEPHRSNSQPHIQRVLAGEHVHYESQMYHQDGTLRDIDVSYTPDVAMDGTVRGFFTLVQDITERKRAERALRQASERLRFHVENTPLGVVEMDSDLRITHWSRRSEEIFGWTAAEMIGRRLTEIRFVHVDDLPVLDNVLEEARRQGDAPIRRTNRNYRKDGSTAYCEWYNSVWGGASGAPSFFSLVLDVTERHTMQEALRLSDERFRTALEQSPIIVFNQDRELRYTWIHNAAPAWANAVVCGQTDHDLLPAPDAERLTRLKRRVLETGERTREEVDIGRQTFDLTIEPLRNTTGGIEGITCAAVDVTDQKRTREDLRASEERWRVLTQAMPALVWTSRPDGYADYSNERWLEYTGQTLPETYGSGWMNVVHPDDHQNIARVWQESLVTGQPYEVQYRIRRAADGMYRWHLVRAWPLRNQAGRIEKWLGASTDVHDVIEAQQALRESEERFRTMADSSPVLIWVAGPDGRCTYLNRTWREFTGRTLEQELGFGWAESVHHDDREAALTGFQEALVQRTPFTLEYRLRRHDAEYRWMIDQGSPRLAADGSLAGYIGSLMDITERRAAEQEVRASNQALRQANAELEEFAYVASHDLQEPLRTIKVYTQLLLRRHAGELSPEAGSYAGFVHSGVERMERLIRDLLSYSRATHGEAYERSEADLNAAVQDALAALDSSAAARGASVQADPLPRVCGDRVQLAVVFQNLISNAIKYCRADVQPRIRITAQQSGAMCTVAVADNGIGFDGRYAERIFGLFKRLHRDEYPGTGLGLAICKRIVERHGGRIWAESAPGAGSTFRFTVRTL